MHDAAVTLEELVRRLTATLEECAGDWEVILVNDASRDASWDVLVDLCRGQPRLRAIDLAANVGQHVALLCGLRAARGEWLVTLDDDLQHPPEAIGALLEAGQGGADLVYGTSPHPDQGPLRRLAAHCARELLALRARTTRARMASALRCFRVRPPELFDPARIPPLPLDLQLLRAARRVVAVPVRMQPSRRGGSRYGALRLVALALGLGSGRSGRGEVRDTLNARP